MKKPVIYTQLCLLLVALCTSTSYAQRKDLQAQSGMTAQPKNYTRFSHPIKDNSGQAIANNPGFENHPETGVLFTDAPCENCYELIGSRTEKSKLFEKIEKSPDGGKDVFQQTSSHSMHYKDATGNWRTIQTLLAPTGTKGVYAASEQPVPVKIDANTGYTMLGGTEKGFSYNNDLELIYAAPDGSFVPLGKADWSHHTAGDDGVYVTNAWPGIDMEIYTIRGATKTNFYVNHAMPEYAAGKLLVRDHFNISSGLSLFSDGKNKLSSNLAIVDKDGVAVYQISAATACEKNGIKNTLKFLDYEINGNTVDIVLPGNFLDRAASAYPVVIDPLVSTATVTPVTGSTYSALWTVPCVYNNAATVPANCTITDIQWSFNYVTSGGAWLNDGAVDFRLGTCRSPGLAGYYWYCNVIGAGTCTGSNISIYADVASCVPAPQCPSYNLNMTMGFYQNYATTAACATTYVSGATPLTITVIGHTVELNPVVVTGASTICAGQSTTLSTSALYGVPPYTYSWMPGSLSGSPVTVSPTTTTTYTATVTDACGITATGTTTITVNPLTPITGTMSVCVGGTTTLSNATAGGAWSSTNTAVATISATGVVYGVSVGTTTISYITPLGCSATATVSVNVLPGITGTLSACVNGSSLLANSFLGGTWTSSNTGVATVSPAGGLVTGNAAGTATITYTTGAGCSTTAVFTVNPLPSPISGPTSVCKGSTVALASTPAGGTWSSSATSVVTVAGGTAGGVAPGVATITYTLPTTCYITQNLTVNPTYSTSFGATICPGASYTFAGNTYYSTGVYPHAFTSVYGCDSIVTLNLTVSPVVHTDQYDSICIGSAFSFNGNLYSTTGNYDATFTNISGCDSFVTLHLFVKPLPPAPFTINIDLCQNATGVPPLTATGSNLLWYPGPTGGVGGPAPVPSTSAPGVFTFYVSQVVAGCEGPRAPIVVTVHNRPFFNIVPGKPYECQYDTISLSYDGPMFPGAQFTWSLPSWSSLSSGLLSDPSIVVTFDTSLGTNDVSLTVGDGYLPCNSTVTYSVPVFLTAPPAGFDVKPYACAGDSVIVALTYTSPGINDYLWNFNGGNVVVASSNHGGPYKVVWPTAGLYVITMSAVTNPNCPATVLYDTIRVEEKPDAHIAPYSVVGDKVIPCMGDSIIFSPLNFDMRYSYHWSPEHYFTQDNASRQYGVIDLPGYIKMTVSTPFGCIAIDSIMVDAQPCCTISFPTAFTPNGDRKNDVFRPIMEGHKKIHFFRIENRWGQVVYESLEESAGSWDGTWQGQAQDMGVYYYYVIYDCGGEDVIKKGDVTLIR